MKRTMLLVLCMLASTAAMAVEWKRHPHLLAAAEQVEAAKKQLAEANDSKKTEFGGHRFKAIELLNQAKVEIAAAAAYSESEAK